MSVDGVRPNENYVTAGKSIRQLIAELGSFENQDLEVRISLDGGDNHYPISILARQLNNMNGNGHVCIVQFEGDE